MGLDLYNIFQKIIDISVDRLYPKSYKSVIARRQVMTTQFISTVDQIGEVKAKIADLKKLEEALLATLKEEGPGEYEGEFFRVVISEVEETSKLDIKAAEKKLRQLGVDGRWINKNQKTTKGYVAARVYAKKS
jgi:hypothetical protein